MVYQITEGVDPSVRKSGCYYRAVLRIVEILIGITFTISQVNRIFQLCVKIGYIGADGWMKEDAGKGVAQVASGLVKEHCYLKRVSKDSANFTISKYTLYGPHFSLEKGDLNEFFDPWSEKGSNTRKNGKLDSYRYFYGEKI